MPTKLYPAKTDINRTKVKFEGKLTEPSSQILERFSTVIHMQFPVDVVDMLTYRAFGNG